MPTFDSDGVRLNYEVFGEGRPIIAIHGFASNIETNWVSTGWVETLNEAGFRVVALDNRGHGRSQKLYAPDLYFAHEMADDVARLMQHEAIDRAPIVGYSMGARVAAFLAVRHPERVAALVLGGMGTTLMTGIANSEAIIAALTAERLSDVTDPQGRQFRIFAEHSKSDRAALAACMISSREPMREADVRSITAPTLVAIGEADTGVGPAQALADLLPDAEALVIPRRDHMRATGDIVFRRAAVEFLARHPS
jgi:pimeloyl-ACP methyl ester carboxylesterase